MAAEHRILAPRRRMLLVEYLALPAAVLRGVGAEIIEERVATEDAAVIEQHHAGQAAIDAVEHADVDGIEAVDDAAFADAAGDRDRLLLDRGHDRTKRHPGQFLEAAFKPVEIAVGFAPRQQRRVVGAGHRPIVRIGIMADGLDLDVDPTIGFCVGADMRKGGITTQHPAAAHIHHAAADRLAKLKPDLVKTLEQ